MDNIEIVNKYTEFNQLIYNKEIEKAFEYIKNNDIKFSGIDKHSNTCFDALKNIYRNYKIDIGSFVNDKNILTDNQLNSFYKIMINLLEKEPQYYYKKNDEKYYFLQLFIDFKDINRFKYFYKMIESVKPSDIEKYYFNSKNRDKDILEIVWQNKAEKVTVEEIKNAYYNSSRTEDFIIYLKEISKNNRKVSYKHEDLKNFINEIRLPKTNETQFLEIYKELNNIYDSSLSKDATYIANHKYSTKFHEILNFVITRFNYSLNTEYGTYEPYNKKITLDLLEYANEKYPSSDYISKFDIINQSETSNIIIKKEGYELNDISPELKNKLHSLFTFLLLPKNQKEYKIIVEESIERLLSYKERYPNEFYNDYINFKSVFEELKVEIKNIEINKIILYFDLLYMENKTTNKKLNKI